MSLYLGRLSPCSAFTCPGGGICSNQGGKAICVCGDCPLFYEPVCGADGVTYNNLCFLKREGCLRTRKIVLAHHGACRESSILQGNHFRSCCDKSTQSI